VNGGKLWESFLRPLLVSPVLAVVAGVIVHAVVRRVSREREGRTRGLEAGHWLSAGAVCFARGLNDTPKMAALMAGSGWLGGSWAMVLVAAAMACGGVMGARRVAETLAHGITGMNPGEGFAANLATALLVTTASVHGLPVSTTHVSVGALLGIGVTTGQARWKTVRPVLAAWVVTLPCAAVLAGGLYAVLRMTGNPRH
jgi:PiT family inorganic phosphate transporter